MTDFRLPSDELEYAVLSLLWQLGTASVRQIHEGIDPSCARAYTTTAKVVDRLRAKGLIARSRIPGGFVYRPAIEPQEVQRARARQLISRFLGPAPSAAAAALVEAVEGIDPGLLDDLERAIKAKRRKKNGT